MCELIARRGECSIEESWTRLGVSGMTVRRNLQSLAEQGKVIRTHGGAAMAERVKLKFEFLQASQGASGREAGDCRRGRGTGHRRRVDSARFGHYHIGSGQAAARKGRLTVVTTSLPIAAQLQYDRHIEVLLLGGWRAARPPPTSPAL